MADLGTLKRGECLKLTRKNDDLLPFEDPSRLEALARKADAGLFVLGSHSKKRPHTLTVGRVFDGRLLDVLELHLSDAAGECKLLREFGSAPTAVAAGHKPCLFFAGGAFDDNGSSSSSSSNYFSPTAPLAAAKSILTDLFRGRVVSKINLAGVDRVIAVAAASSEGGGVGGGDGSKRPAAEQLCVRQFAIALKKSGGRVPRVQLTEVGPSIRASVGRFRPAPPDLWKAAMRVPEGVEKRKVKRFFFIFYFREREKKKLKKRKQKKFKGAVTKLSYPFYISDTSCLSGEGGISLPPFDERTDTHFIIPERFFGSVFFFFLQKKTKETHPFFFFILL